jgi:four helix bundle protein
LCMRTHKELLAWQRANTVALGVHRYARKHWTNETATVFNQIRRASLSVQLNIAEGFASGRGLRCKNLLRVAYGSAVETTELLEFLIELGGNGIKELHDLQATSRETQALTLRLWQKTTAPRQ